MPYGVAQNGTGMWVVLTAGGTSSDCNRVAYSGMSIIVIPWDDTENGWISAKVGVGNRWILRNFNMWGVSNDTYLQSNGYITAVKVGNGNTITVYDSYGSTHSVTYADGRNAPNALTDGNAYTSSLSCTAGGTVVFHNYDNNHSFNISKEAFNSSGALHLGGEVVQFVATPDAHYRVKRWLLNGTQVAGRGVNTADITFPSSAATVACEFEQYQFRVTVKTDGTPGCKISKTLSQQYMESGQQTGNITASVETAEQPNYKFLGWYKGYGNNLSPSACNTLVTTNATINITAEGQDVTYVAKFGSRKTTLRVGVIGNGTFDLYVDGVKKANRQSSYVDTANARDGQQARLIAYAGSDSYFSNWEVPQGTASYDNIYETDVTRTLIARSENKFTATFVKKVQVNVVCSVTGGTGQGTFSGFGNFTQSSSLTARPWQETEYSVTATETNKLYGFSRWEYKVGSSWYTVSQDSLPNWIRQVDGAKLVIYIPGGDSVGKELRAVFYKKTTYTAPQPTIEGEHPINKNLASASGSGCSVSLSPSPDEGTNKWLSGTQMTVRATAGAKWKLLRIEVVFQNKGTQTFTGATASFKLTENVTAIRAIFDARQYWVSVAMASGSDAVATTEGNAPTVKFDYHPLTNPTGWESSIGANVYVDTAIRLHAETLADYSSTARFRQWFLNDVPYSTTAELNDIKITGTSAFSAQFESQMQFSLSDDSREIVGQQTNWYGDIKISYSNTSGTTTSETLPSGDKASTTLWLVCGSTYDLDATARTIPGSVPVQGYFSGWFNWVWVSGVETLVRIDGWGTNVSDQVVGVPRRIVAQFANQEVWPILRLRNPPDGLFCAFSVSNVRPERVQTINVKQGSSTVKRTITLIDPNDYFCDPFSMVQIRLDLYDSSTKFQVWQQMEFGQDDPPVPGTSVLDPSFATTQDLSVFMTGNAYFMPIFWSGTPITAIAGLTEDSEATFGDVSLEGDFVEQVSDTQGTFVQGATATFVASPRNGYRFVGWFSSPSGSGTAVSTEARFAVAMNTTQSFYARFVQDTNAIYTFGTGVAAKTMRWRSRRVTTTVPVSFSTAQVDVEGAYDDVRLTVYHSSSPEVPYQVSEYTIADGNSRRLALGGRPEKCFEFEVGTSHPVNFMGVGTSVNALLSGGQA